MRIRKQLLKRIIIAVSVLILIPLIIFLIYAIIKASGKNSLYSESQTNKPSLVGNNTTLQVEIIEEDNSYDWQEGDIRYNGEIYRYNDKILTFLVMGVDKMEKVSDKPVTNYIDGGQSDALFLAVLDDTKSAVNIIAINRNTMADVDVYDKNDAYLGTEKLQITLQHGYGDGKESSCERTVKTVSRFLYDLPIHGYAAINMGAVPEINNAVGGVDVKIEEKIINGSKTINDHVGQTVTLKGKDAYIYIHNRDTKEFGSADKRLSRQKIYLKAFVDKAKQKTKEQITFPMSLYNTAKDYVVTDISVSKMVYLATEVLSYDFDMENIVTLEGETVMGKEFEEFYPDEDALLKLIIETFYEKL